MELEKLPNPFRYLRELRDELEARNQKKLFFDQQFRKMVENGNVEKAVELLYDESRNLDARVNREISPEELADYCIERCQEHETEEFNNAVKEIEEKYLKG